MKKFLQLFLVFSVILLGTQALAGPLPGAIFTTLVDGSAVNHNIYEQKEDVYLDGGPGPNAPIGAAGLPEGWYYFQVTDPSGKVLLSQDPVKCRMFHVSDEGVIDEISSASYIASLKGKIKTATVDCTHATGTDIDHNAITVQLMPFANTPNNGGVYKVWITPIEYFIGNPNLINNPDYFHGFRPSWSKTDNYKVKKGKPFTPPVIRVLKVNDLNVNGYWDGGEPQIYGWPVSALDPLDVLNTGFTLWEIMAVPNGLWVTSEEVLPGWMPTGSIRDNVYQTAPWTIVNVNIAGTSGETHTVVFLNAELGQIKACKKYASASGVPVAGWKMCLSGTLVNGGTYGPVCQYTDGTGCATFGNLTSNLIAGNYTVCEVMPAGQWFNSGPLCQNVTLDPGENETATFVNYCTGKALMHTKGFWQNPNGCALVTTGDLDYLNGLAPYISGSIETGGMDNCAGVKCPAITNHPLDSPNELGCMIVASNSQSTYPHIGLSQQLAAFVMNCRHWMGSMNSIIVLPGGNMSAQQIIDAAVSAWVSGANVSYWQSKLDALNNAGYVDIINGVPCAVNYE